MSKRDSRRKVTTDQSAVQMEMRVGPLPTDGRYESAAFFCESEVGRGTTFTAWFPGAVVGL